MHPFWKHQKTLQLSNVLRGYRKGALRRNGLIYLKNGEYIYIDKGFTGAVLIDFKKVLNTINPLQSSVAFL